MIAPKKETAKFSDNSESCPRFIAFIADDYLEADESIDELIAIVKRCNRRTGNDVVVWDGWSNVAAIVFADGVVQRFGERVAERLAAK